MAKKHKQVFELRVVVATLSKDKLNEDIVFQLLQDQMSRDCYESDEDRAVLQPSFVHPDIKEIAWKDAEGDTVDYLTLKRLKADWDLLYCGGD